MLHIKIAPIKLCVLYFPPKLNKKNYCVHICIGFKILWISLSLLMPVISWILLQVPCNILGGIPVSSRITLPRSAVWMVDNFKMK